MPTYTPNTLFPLPQPTAVHISQSPQRRRLREGRAELGDVTEPSPVLLCFRILYRVNVIKLAGETAKKVLLSVIRDLILI